MNREDQQFLSGMMDGEWQALDVRRAIADVCADAALREKWSRYHLARHAMQCESVLPDGALAERIARAIADEPSYSNVTAIGTGVTGTVPDVALTDDADVEVGTVAGALAARAATGEPRAAALGTPGHSALVALSTPTRTTSRTFAAGFGLAASVAVVTALGLNTLRGGEGGTPGPLASDAAREMQQVASSVFLEPMGSGIDPFARQTSGALLPNVDLVSNEAASGAYWVAPGSSARRADSEELLNMFLSQHIENSPTAERQGMLPYSRLVGYDERAAVGR